MLNKQRTFEILNKARYGDTASRIFDISLTTLILANLAAVSLESVRIINNNKYRIYFIYFEYFS